MFDYSKEIIKQNWRDFRQTVFFPPKRRKEGLRILVVQVEGLGNAVLTTPLITALANLNPLPIIDLLIDKNRGMDMVFSNWNLINQIYDINEKKPGVKQVYDVVLECHLRKELPFSIQYRKRFRLQIELEKGLEYHWCFKKHEADYLVDIARKIGYLGNRPSIRNLSVNEISITVPPRTVAIGIGYLKNIKPGGRIWSDRHWGNENFFRLCEQLLNFGYNPVLVGDQKDYETDGKELVEMGVSSICGKYSLSEVIAFLGKCVAFIGNDTGLMHLAASVDIPTIGIFVSTNSVKSYPLGSKCIALGGNDGPKTYVISVEVVLNSFQSLLKNVT